MRPCPIRLSIPLQGAAAIGALLALAMWPPSSGEMLLVPITGGDVNLVAKVALAGGAMLVGAGPLPRSLVVSGERDRIARQIPGWTIIVMAAPPAGCTARAVSKDAA